MSSVPAVKAALRTTIAAVLPNSQVLNGPATAETAVGERFVEIGRAVGDRKPSNIVGTIFTEDYTIEIKFSVWVPGPGDESYLLAQNEVLADYTAAEAAIREHAQAPNLGLDADGVGLVENTGRFEQDGAATGKGRWAWALTSVHVRAQTT